MPHPVSSCTSSSPSGSYAHPHTTNWFYCLFKIHSSQTLSPPSPSFNFFVVLFIPVRLGFLEGETQYQKSAYIPPSPHVHLTIIAFPSTPFVICKSGSSQSFLSTRSQDFHFQYYPSSIIPSSILLSIVDCRQSVMQRSEVSPLCTGQLSKRLHVSMNLFNKA